ncbi:helicase-associated domain-containing protein [Microbacterium sp. CFBP9034]|uniref:helicase-associated domain-containing protein n=1 Tax=Microbacterium sp. CFBP9034 TaxID=3096540 RepID=UPI002A6B8FE6|nr:helicase-associated domain-containing protein [Microbacterium sp. CFBP9034]MDY0910852.1 helicase-associated domain-containing protein [Microbacterium sp. CFBP9034]
MVSDERALATWLAALDDEGLAATLAGRGVPASVAWHDFFDASEGLLDAASLDRALARLPRSALSALAGDAPVTDGALQRLALIDASGHPYAAVKDRIDQLSASRPAAFDIAPSPPPPVAADDRTAAAAAERAFTTAGSLADALLACLHSPFARTGSGVVSAAERKRLGDTGAVGATEDIEDLLAAAEAAGLAAAEDRQWVVTPEGERWLESSTARRWTVLAEGFRDALPEGLRTDSGGFVDPAAWADAYPLDPEWPLRVARMQRIGARWGLLTADGSELPWTAVLREGLPADATTLGVHLPAEIDRVYLQADLTAIAPGPLAPALDLRLRAIAVRESRAQASTYRFTADSLGAGMTEGETAGSIREFLAQLSLTGIPQPLDYLIESTAARHGLVRVRADEVTGRAVVESPDVSLRETIAIDQALRPLGLIPDGDVLLSRVTRDTVYWSLADARYPVVALDASGAPESVRRRAVAIDSPGASSPTGTYARLLSELRNGHGTEGEEGWLGRELEQAVRGRSEIVVVVRMPDGAERTLTLEASGLGGGRLRGRDRAADIERTLPVSSIVSVRPA